jgi:hypothetical protein
MRQSEKEGRSTMVVQSGGEIHPSPAESTVDENEGMKDMRERREFGGCVRKAPRGSAPKPGGRHPDTGREEEALKL